MADAVDRWKLVSFHTSAGSSVIPTATLELQCEDQAVLRDAAIGDGPIDAVFKAMERITDMSATLDEFDVRSVSEGEDRRSAKFVSRSQSTVGGTREKV